MAQLLLDRIDIDSILDTVRSIGMPEDMGVNSNPSIFLQVSKDRMICTVLYFVSLLSIEEIFVICFLYKLLESLREVLRDINDSILSSFSVLHDDPILEYILPSEIREFSSPESCIDECIEYETVSLA